MCFMITVQFVLKQWVGLVSYMHWYKNSIPTAREKSLDTVALYVLARGYSLYLKADREATAFLTKIWHGQICF